MDFFYAREPLEIKTFAVFEHKRTPLQAILRRGFVRFTVFVVTLAKVSVKFMGIR